MNFLPLKSAIVASMFLLAMGNGDIARAHSLAGALNSPARATDLYRVTCFAEDGGPASGRLRLRVRDNGPVKKPMVSVQVHKGLVVTNGTDGTDGNAGYSPWVVNNGGDGVYNVFVDKSARGAESYSLDYHCESSTGIHTGTAHVQLQNQ